MAKRSAEARRQELMRQQGVRVKPPVLPTDRAERRVRNQTQSRHPADRPPVLDRVALWLNHRSRVARAILAGIIAAVITGVIALLLVGYLLNVRTGTMLYDAANSENASSIILLILVIIGVALYLVGWRVFIGFDFGEYAMQPGRPGAIWLLFGGIMLILVLAIMLISVIQASAP